MPSKLSSSRDHCNRRQMLTQQFPDQSLSRVTQWKLTFPEEEDEKNDAALHEGKVPLEKPSHS